MRDKERYEILRQYHQADGGLNYSLEVFGDALAEREGYKDLDGIEAIHFYLIHKFSWLPRDVRSMTFEDIRLVLSQEMHGWTLPREARLS